MIFSIMVLWANRLKDWNTIPIFRRTRFTLHFLSVVITPSTTISPPVGVSRRLIQRSRVDFPVPDGPIMEITSPFLISTLTSRKGITLGYSLRRCLIEMMLRSSCFSVITWTPPLRSVYSVSAKLPFLQRKGLPSSHWQRQNRSPPSRSAGKTPPWYATG